MSEELSPLIDKIDTPRNIEAVIRDHVIYVLTFTNGNQRKAAPILGITRWTLARWLKKYGLVIENKLVIPVEAK